MKYMYPPNIQEQLDSIDAMIEDLYLSKVRIIQHSVPKILVTEEEIKGTDFEKLARELKSKPMTNADRIRNMSDEELAEFLEGFTVCDHCEYYKNERCAMENPCVHAFAEAMAFKWIQAEVEGDSE